jgi:uncharacterized protein
MNLFISTILQLVVIFMIGATLGFMRRGQFSLKWFCVVLALIFSSYFFNTAGFGLLPDLWPESKWNWSGKFYSLCFSLAIMAHPAFGFKRSGFTLAQNPDGQKLTYGIALGLCALVTFTSILDANVPTNTEILAFQLTMPGFEEEPFYRGILLIGLNEAFKMKKKILGISLGWGSLLSTLLFGMVHGFGITDKGLIFDIGSIIKTGLFGIVLIWFRERTGSLLLPVVIHNFINSIDLIV